MKKVIGKKLTFSFLFLLFSILGIGLYIRGFESDLAVEITGDILSGASVGDMKRGKLMSPSIAALLSEKNNNQLTAMMRDDMLKVLDIYFDKSKENSRDIQQIEERLSKLEKKDTTVETDELGYQIYASALNDKKFICPEGWKQLDQHKHCYTLIGCGGFNYAVLCQKKKSKERVKIGTSCTKDLSVVYFSTDTYKIQYLEGKIDQNGSCLGNSNTYKIQTGSPWDNKVIHI